MSAPATYSYWGAFTNPLRALQPLYLIGVMTYVVVERVDITWVVTLKIFGGLLAVVVLQIALVFVWFLGSFAVSRLRKSVNL